MADKMKKVLCSPGTYIQGTGEIKELGSHFLRVGKKKAYLIVDKFILDTYGRDIQEDFKRQGISYEIAAFGGECSKREIEKHIDQLQEADVIFGIGGGKTLDTAKAAAYYSKLPVIIVPTAASSDAPCSRLSVVYTDEGEFEEYLFLRANPDVIVMDIDVVAHAPVRLLVAGIGDALATCYEAEACRESGAVNMVGGSITNGALAIARVCKKILLEDGKKAKISVENRVVTKALENIVEANTYLSGIGFESGGLSGAHAIHNGLTVLPQCHHMLHGEKVAFGTITQLILENRSDEELDQLITFCQEIGLPTTLADLGLGDAADDVLMEAAAAGCAENDTMGNLPFKVNAEEVFGAMKLASSYAQALKSK